MIVMRNPRGTGVIEPPVRPDGTLYRFEMIYDGAKYRAYADSATELCEALIPGYEHLEDPAEQATARIEFAVAQQVALQAAILAESHRSACTDDERDVLLSPRHVPPQLEIWEADVPLVLVDLYYEPHELRAHSERLDDVTA